MTRVAPVFNPSGLCIFTYTELGNMIAIATVDFSL